MIAWTYLDKKTATVAVLRDYENMKLIIASTSKEVKDAYDNMFSIRSTQIDGLPKTYNPQAGEDKVVNSLDKIDIMQERYRQAVEYMAWFEPAWLSITDEERIILKEFYMQSSQRSGASARICTTLCYSEAHVERLRSKSLKVLTKLLYGG